MKKILLISPQPFFQWRGSPIRVNFNIQALAQLGYAVDLLTLPIGERRKLEGVNVIRVANPFRIEQIPIGPSLYKIFFDILIFQTLPKTNLSRKATICRNLYKKRQLLYWQLRN